MPLMDGKYSTVPQPCYPLVCWRVLSVLPVAVTLLCALLYKLPRTCDFISPGSGPSITIARSHGNFSRLRSHQIVFQKQLHPLTFLPAKCKESTFPTSLPMLDF